MESLSKVGSNLNLDRWVVEGAFCPSKVNLCHKANANPNQCFLLSFNNLWIGLSLFFSALAAITLLRHMGESKSMWRQKKVAGLDLIFIIVGLFSQHCIQHKCT